MPRTSPHRSCPPERGYRLDHRDVGRSARLDMQKALDLAVKSRERVR